MGELAGARTLVTGGSRGTGQAIAVEFAREGADVAINYRRDAQAAAATGEAVRAEGGRAIAVQADVSDWPCVARMVDDVIGEFGHLDIVVANSGIASRVSPLWQVDIEHWQGVIAVNLHGVFHTCKATAKHLVDRGKGCSLLVSSIAADTCAPFGAPYQVAKAGVNALMKTLAKECAPAGVRVNCIAPGLIATDMGNRLIEYHGEGVIQGIPLRRAGRPEEVAKLAVCLASEDAAFITGKIHRIDGGAHM